MNYEFPRIRNLDDVLPHIEGSSEFILAERDDYMVVNYVVQTPDTFPEVNVAGGSAKMRAARSLGAAVRRECRGLIFNPAGELISRPYHKFFNQDERPETHVNRVDLGQPHVILDKLDGSMIRPVWIGDDVRLGTKMGITDVAMAAEEFMMSMPQIGIRELCAHMRAQNITPIFEWCSPENRIVVNYAEPDLILTGLRDNVTGAYAAYDVMMAMAVQHNVSVVGTVTPQALAGVADAEDIEGYIIRFANGHMVKLKCAWYTRLHGVIDIVASQRRVTELILNSEIDDVKPMMQPNDLARVEAYERELIAAVDAYAVRVRDVTDHARYHSRDRKQFATEYAMKQDAVTRAIMFQLYDEVALDRARSLVRERVLKDCNRDVNFHEMRDQIMPGLEF